MKLKQKKRSQQPDKQKVCCIYCGKVKERQCHNCPHCDFPRIEIREREKGYENNIFGY